METARQMSARPNFVRNCKAFDVKATKRQAAKYRQGRGLLFTRSGGAMLTDDELDKKNVPAVWACDL